MMYTFNSNQSSEACTENNNNHHNSSSSHNNNNNIMDFKFKRASPTSSGSSTNSLSSSGVIPLAQKNANNSSYFFPRQFFEAASQQQQQHRDVKMLNSVAIKVEHDDDECEAAAATTAAAAMSDDSDSNEGDTLSQANTMSPSNGNHNSSSPDGNGSVNGSVASDDVAPSGDNIRHLFGKCKICGDKATGIHYGVASCEACKGFYKRSTLRKERYTCFSSNNCKITVKNRGNCKACRLRKCIQSGMSLHAIKMGRIPILLKQQLINTLKDVSGNSDVKDQSVTNLLEKNRESFLYRDRRKEEELNSYFAELSRMNPNGTASDYSGSNSLDEHGSRRVDTTIKDIVMTHAPFKDSNLMPELMLSQLFNDSMHSDRSLILSSILCDKVNQVYCDFTEDVQWMEERARKMIENGITHTQPPNLTTQDVLRLLEKTRYTSLSYLLKFAQRIPGLRDLFSDSDFESFIDKRRLEIGFVKYSSLQINGESYYFLSNDVQYTRSMMHVVHGNLIANEMMSYVQQLNALNLTSREKALVCALLLTAPDDKLPFAHELAKLNEYYLRATLYEFDINRRDPAFLNKLSSMLAKLSNMGKLSRCDATFKPIFL